ncbi:MAG: DNA repair protein RecO [Nitratireductor sp.]|uniref:DNA repair protein RecO n=1 Tax=Nitratireductor sp. B36 TaxID=2762059 RepID=UPI000C8CD5A6|nr:DNA repair protein RecO [Nitratireductor sp. B36]MAS15168.1 DNA repair protein RecO [Nitratireductor sp.]MCC5778091.1 DNA repair protein RecO [Nitratireductor sp. B36]
MEWRDEGIILGARKHGETSVVLETMTAAHGRHLGLVKGGRSRRMQPLLQPGNRVDLVWRARLEEHLGAFQVEPLELNAARLLASALAVHGIQLLGAHLRLMPERDAHAGLYEAVKVITEHLDEPEIAGPLMVRFELAMLEELGFGLDLTKCALTGNRHSLAYVSPKSGRAVTEEAGAPWRDRLLPLPGFLTAKKRSEASLDALKDAYRLTGFFLHRNVYEPRGMEEPVSRGGFLAALARSTEGAAG